MQVQEFTDGILMGLFFWMKYAKVCTRKEVVFVNVHQHGQGLTEYALIIALVAIVVIVALTLLGPTISNMYADIIAALP